MEDLERTHNLGMLTLPSLLRDVGALKEIEPKETGPLCKWKKSLTFSVWIDDKPCTEGEVVMFEW